MLKWYSPNSLISAIPLVSFRVIFSLCMVIGTLRFALLGWIHEQYIAPKFHFRYYGFEWVPIPGAFGIYALFCILLLASLAMLVGFKYRVAAITVFVCFTWIELIDKTYYLNHYYFISLMSLIMCFLPANCLYSIDVVKNSTLRHNQIPRLYIDILKIQLGLVYFFAGIAKINTAWLLDAMPLKIWLPANDTMPIIGPLLRFEETAYLFSWFGMLFDCFVPFLLLYGPTRIYAWFAALVFHGATGYMFQIGMFPLIMSCSILIFFSDAAHLRAWNFIINLLPFHRVTKVVPTKSATISKIGLMLTASYLCIQMLLPLRYLLYPGNLFWNEDGYRFSWRVMLMEKSGSAQFYVTPKITNQEGAITNDSFLNRHQEKQMAMQPDMILQFAHFLGKQYNASKVRAEVYVTLNGQKSKLLVDPNVNLLHFSDGLHPKLFVLPND